MTAILPLFCIVIGIIVIYPLHTSPGIVEGDSVPAFQQVRLPFFQRIKYFFCQISTILVLYPDGSRGWTMMTTKRSGVSTGQVPC